MKIKLINKDKGTAPPTKAFDFRPNRTVDSNPKLDNMKGDYVSPKKQKRRKYYVGGNFDKYAVAYQPLQVAESNNKLKISRYMPQQIIKLSKEEPTQDNQESEDQYSISWGTSDKAVDTGSLPSTLAELLTQEGISFQITSGYRPGARTAQGYMSHHSEGDANNPGAYDVVPTSGDYDAFEKAIYSNPRILAWLDAKGWGSLREDKLVNGQRGFLRTDGTFANTGATGPHFHFGPDKRALEWKEVNRRKYATS